MKFKYIVVYENSSDKFDIGHCQGHGTTLKFTAIQTVRSHNETLAQARKLVISM